MSYRRRKMMAAQKKWVTVEWIQSPLNKNVTGFQFEDVVMDKNSPLELNFQILQLRTDLNADVVILNSWKSTTVAIQLAVVGSTTNILRLRYGNGPTDLFANVYKNDIIKVTSDSAYVYIKNETQNETATKVKGDSYPPYYIEFPRIGQIRIFSAHINDLDLIPVRVGTNVGLLDKRSGKIIFPRTQEGWTYGPDKNEMEVETV